MKYNEMSFFEFSVILDQMAKNSKPTNLEPKNRKFSAKKAQLDYMAKILKSISFSRFPAVFELKIKASRLRDFRPDRLLIFGRWPRFRNLSIF